VRVDETEPMLRALGAAGADHHVLPDGAIAVDGFDPAAIGKIAAGAGVAVAELSRLGAGETLEALFLQLTGDASR
jgi:hypothetical protein